jgi:hypothetical protein
MTSVALFGSRPLSQACLGMLYKEPNDTVKIEYLSIGD